LTCAASRHAGRLRAKTEAAAATVHDVSAALVESAREIIAETHPRGASRLENGP